MTITATRSPHAAAGIADDIAMAAAIEEALLDCCRLCLSRSEGAALHETDDALWFQTGVPFPMYNGIYRPHFADAGDDPEAIHDALAALVGPFKAEKVPMVLCVGPLSQGQPLHAAARRLGLWKVASIPGMAIDLAQLSPSWRDDAPLAITQVRCEDELRAWVAVQNDCFGFPRWVAEATFAMTRPALDDPDGPVRLYLGRDGDTPVATSMTVARHPHVGIFNVACIPEARRRGFGAAITAAPFLDAHKEGHLYGILHATPDGLPLYQKMGFETYCHLDNYLYAPLGTVLSLAFTTICRNIAHFFRALGIEH